jgi:hypothetical protein
VRSVVDTPCHNYLYARDRPTLTYPLDHIDPTGPWFGFDRVGMPGPGRDGIASTKLLVATVCWTATALVAMRAGVYVPDKGAAVAAYREHVGVCERALLFQNHFLRCYREFQLAELRSGVADRQVLAARQLGQIRFPEAEVVAALRGLCGANRDEVRHAAAETLAGYP